GERLRERLRPDRRGRHRLLGADVRPGPPAHQVDARGGGRPGREERRRPGRGGLTPVTWTARWAAPVAPEPRQCGRKRARPAPRDAPPHAGRSPAEGVAPCAADASVFLPPGGRTAARSEEHTSELQSRENLVCRL